MRAEQGAWPLHDDPCDPWGEPFPEDDLGWVDLCSFDLIELPTKQEYERRALILQRELTAVLRGVRPLDPERLNSLARRAHIAMSDGRVDRRPVKIAPYAVPESVVLRIALDIDPAAGLFGPAAALGPWALIAEPNDPRHRQTLAWGLAHWAAGRPTIHPPLQVWRRAKHAPAPRDRKAVSAISRAPLGLWEVRARGDRWHLRDTLGLAPHRCPTAPLSLDHAAGFGTLTDGALVLARVVPLADGTARAFAPLVLPGTPPAATATAALQVLLTAHRIRARRATPADALRDRAAAFCRLLHQACWPG